MSGAKVPGKRHSGPTIHTIAAAAGVSIATVSYVLSGRDRSDSKIKITSATRNRVLLAAEDLGYAPSQMARGVRRGRTDQVCIVLGFLESPWTQAMINAVSAAARDIGKTSLLLLDGDWRRFLSGRGADGAVIHGDHLREGDDELLRRLAERGMDLVVIDSDIEPRGFDIMRQQPRPALDDAVDLLASRHRRIACIVRGGKTVDQTLRYGSYVSGLARAGIRFDPSLVCRIGVSREQAYRQTLFLLEQPRPPTAIFATSDFAAIGALWAARRMGIDVPGELEILGVGNSPEGRSADPPLSSVGAESVFTDVAQMLADRMTTPEEGTGIVRYSNWSIYRRGTTRP